MATVVPLADRDDIRLTTQGAYPSPDELAFVRKVQDWWKESDDVQGEWLKEEKGEHDFALGHQWAEEDYNLISKSGRYPLVLNKTLSTLLVVSGHERGNRMRVRYLPVEQGDNATAETWTEVARIVQEQGDIDFNKSEAFFDMLKGGRGFVHLRLCYDSNPAGEIVSDLVPPWELRIDPFCRSYDLNNARWVIWSKDVSLEELLVLWPEKSDEILAAQQATAGRDDSMTLSDRDDDYDALVTRAFDKITNKWMLREVWYWQVEKVAEFMVKNPMSNEWTPVMTEDEVKLLLLQFPEIEWRREPQYERKYYQAFVVGPLLLENNPSYLDYKGYPFVPFNGLYDSEQGRYLGMTYHIKDPQIEVNKRRTQVLHIVNQSAKSGWYGPKGAFVDRDQWEKKSGLPGFIGEYEVDSGQNPPQPIQPQPIPSAFVQLEQMALQDFRDITGVNIDLMGLGTSDTPGIVISQRQRQAMIILQIYFDNLRRSTKILGRLLLSMMQQFYTDGRQFTITGKQAQLGGDMKTGRYDLIVEESPFSPNQKMETALKLKEVIQVALGAGVPVPPDVLDYLDLPETLAEKWRKFIEERMQQSQQPDPRVELEMQKLQLQLRDLMRKEFDSHFKALLTVAQAEAQEIGTQIQQYESIVNQFNLERDREQQAIQMQQQQQQQQQGQTGG